MIERLAHSMAPVAVYGESGSGKELVARAIHDSSARRLMPFVAVNCGAIPEALMEAEFFGYRKGAFTGAERDREGFFHAAGGGTLFLDEIAELPLSMQVKLLRAIQERRVRKVGSTTEDPVDVRILSATHQDLGKLVAAGRFRQDLYYRLNVIELHVPSLRERREDIAVLAEAILDRLAQRGGGRAQLAADALTELRGYSFPGNVRELENILERGVALAVGRELSAADLMLPSAEVAEVQSAPAAAPPAAAAVATSPVPGALPDAARAAPAAAPLRPGAVPSDLVAYLDAMESAALQAALARTGGNRTAAAQLLGITFRQLRYRMQRLGLK
jgi:two-component system response regulator PilR (NtrC family)